MMEFSLKIGDEKIEPLETALILNCLAGILQWTFFIILAIIYIKKKNAGSSKDKHS